MLLLDLLLVVMMLVCIGYCWVLNRRIHDLQNSRIEFARMVKELNVSILKASASVSDLNDLSKITHQELKLSIDSANNMVTELLNINKVGHETLGKLNKQIMLAKKYQENNSLDFAGEQQENSNSRADSYFNDDDLIREEAPDLDNDYQKKSTDSSVKSDIDAKDKVNYAGQVKDFLYNMVSKKTEDGLNLNQVSYYDSLRRISTKK